MQAWRKASFCLIVLMKSARRVAEEGVSVCFLFCRVVLVGVGLVSVFTIFTSKQ